MYALGTMSGTSMDGADIALLYIDENENIEEKGHISISYESETKRLLRAAKYVVTKYEGNLIASRKHFSQVFKEYLKDECHMEEAAIPHEISKLATYLHGIDKANKPITLDAIILH